MQSALGFIRRQLAIGKANSPAIFFGVRRSGVRRSFSHTLSPSQSTKAPLAAEDLSQVHELLKSDIHADKVNELLIRAIPEDFSVYFTLINSGKSHSWSDEALVTLIEANPGRVFTAQDLLKRHAINPNLKVLFSVIKKLLLGEKSDLRDEPTYVPSSESLVHAARMTKLLEQPEKFQALEFWWEYLLENKAPSAFFQLCDENTEQWVAGKLDAVSDLYNFLILSRLMFTRKPHILTKVQYSKILKTWGLVSAEKLQVALDADKSVYTALGYEDYAPISEDFFNAVLDYINDAKFDTDTRDPELLLLRMQMIETYAIDKDDTTTALRKFHEYQAVEKLGLELIQAKVVQAFCYHAFKHEEPTSLKIAETLLDPQELAVNTVAQLILAHGAFSPEKLLEVYNDYINLVLKDVNQHSKRSASGILTEAAMAANLYDGDREFAMLLLEKAVQNKIVKEELEIAQMRNLFKVYGEAYEDDSWDKAKEILKRYILQKIKAL